MEEHTATPFILSLLGGLFIVAGTVMGFLYLSSYTYYPSTGYATPFLVTAGICGFLILLATFLLYWRPALHVAWGVMILVLSVASMFGLTTGYYALFGGIGVVFGLIGGALTISPRIGRPPIHPAGLMRMCHVCGRYIPMSTAFCIYCGAAAPTFPPAGPASGSPPPSPPRP